MRLIEDIKSKIDIFSIYPKAKIDIGRALDRINRFLNERDNSREYREFVAELYRSNGFTVWEYGQEDRSLNMVLKRGRDIFLVTCRDDNRNISLDEVKDFEMEMELFLKEYSIFDGYKRVFRYTLSGFFLEEEAFEYINSSEHIDFDIIKKIF
ncbi:MAG: hypothetical protein GXO06_00020 [Epsilonproteobacteria bacterium]|nr:hypothetical protein [Campylobacterota bacterium]